MTDETANRAIAAMIVGFIALWTAAASLTHAAPPLDVIEELIWGNEWLWGSDKHPLLSAWLTEIFWQIGGMGGVYFLASLAPAMGLWLVFLLGRRLFSAAQGFLGAALLLGVFYFLWPVPEFNHNMAQMPLWAAVIFLFHLCLTENRLHHWLFLGVAGALCILTKYISVFLLLCVPGWLFFDPQARRLLLTPGPWIGLIAFLVGIFPHLFFLAKSGFLPLAYAVERAGEGHSPFWFLLVQGLNHLPMIFILAAAGFFGRDMITFSYRSLSRDDRFLLVFALLPLLLFVLALSVWGAGFRSLWGAPFFMLSGLLAVRFFGGRWTELRLRRACYGVIALLLLAPVCYGASIAGRHFFLDKPKRVHWPQAQISASVEEHFRAHANRPPEIIVGRVEIAGLAAIGIKTKSRARRPQVLIEGDFQSSPWVKKEEICHATALLWKASRPITEELFALMDQCGRKDAEIIKLVIPVPGFENHPPLILNMVVLAD